MKDFEIRMPNVCKISFLKKKLLCEIDCTPAGGNNFLYLFIHEKRDTLR